MGSIEVWIKLSLNRKLYCEYHNLRWISRDRQWDGQPLPPRGCTCCHIVSTLRGHLGRTTQYTFPIYCSEPMTRHLYTYNDILTFFFLWISDLDVHDIYFYTVSLCLLFRNWRAGPFIEDKSMYVYQFNNKWKANF